MLEGLRTAAAGMQAQQQKLDAVSNDLANANTNGYKRLRTGFSDLLYEQGGRPTTSANAQLGAGSRLVHNGRTFQQGSLRETGDPLNVGIEGEGFIKIKLPDGRQALTRDGDLHVDGMRPPRTSSGGSSSRRSRSPRASAEPDLDRPGRHRARRRPERRQDRARDRPLAARTSSPSAHQRLRGHREVRQRRRRARRDRPQAGHARGLQHRRRRRR